VLCLLGCDLHEMVAFDSGMTENIDGPEAPDGVPSCTEGCSCCIEDAL